jgi:HK97 gp10 family phage protein
MAKVTGAAKVEARLKRMPPATVRAVGQALFEGAEILKAEAQVSITTGAVSGKNHVPSAPGEPPNEDTGTLRRNIISTQPAPLRARVSSNAPYSAFLEYCTSKMAARPFMVPAARKVRQQVVDLVQAAVNRATKG